MAIKIRLTRGGSKKRPFYRVVAADSRMPRDGRFIEKLGTYNPLLPKDDPNRVDLNVDKINEWLKKGAQISDRISRLLENLSVLKPKKRDNPKKGQKHKATLERETAKSEKESKKDAEENPNIKDESSGEASEEPKKDAEENPNIKDESSGEASEEKISDVDINEVNDTKNEEVDKELKLNENKTDDRNETETNKQEEEEKKVSDEEKVDENLKSEEPKEK